MSNSTQLNFEFMDDNPSTPFDIFNAFVQATEDALTANTNIVCTAGGTIPLTAAQIQQNAALFLTGTPGAGFSVSFPASKKRSIAFINSTGQTATIRQGTGTATVAIATTAKQICWADGSNSVYGF